MDKKHAVIFAMVLVLIGAASFMYASSHREPPKARQIAIMVNGQPIYQDQIDAEIATLPERQRTIADSDKAIDFLIEKTLLLNEAGNEGITASTEDVKALYESYNDPEAAIKQQNLTMAEFLGRLEEQAIINKLLDQKIKASPIIKNEEVRQIYDLNYKGRNISFADAESEIVQLIIEKKPEISQRAYIDSLKNKAVVEKLI
jgi:hypothetical protein